MTPGEHITRLAPSPTGALHLGNARTFVLTWAMARQADWRVLLRIEDLDTPRVKPDAAREIAGTLTWLGMDWDGPDGQLAGSGVEDQAVLVQSSDLSPYREAMRRLARAGLVYPCVLSRTEIERAASAPQDGSHESPFPRSLRPSHAGRPLEFDQTQAQLLASSPEGANWRLIVEPGLTGVSDLFAGEREFEVSELIGDFVVWTKRDQPSYQLAVVVDDARQGVTHVIRGDDLLDSAARQQLLQRALGLKTPRYGHLPLVLGPDGKRLAKRHGDSRVESYRAMGVPAEAILGLIAFWSIPGAGRERMSVRAFVARFDATTLPRAAITMRPEDHRWLLEHARA